tara:strand:+ start:1354 stop:1692 length:339 start_codon:yes stop_codon:yes gene_type:complete
MLINVKRWSKDNLTRYYLTDENDGDLGYVQEKTLSRTADNHYDRHRIVKGDTEKFDVTHTINNEDVLNAITYKNRDGERHIQIPLLNRHAGAYKVIRGKKKAQWVPSEPIVT